MPSFPLGSWPHISCLFRLYCSYCGLSNLQRKRSRRARQYCVQLGRIPWPRQTAFHWPTIRMTGCFRTLWWMMGSPHQRNGEIQESNSVEMRISRIHPSKFWHLLLATRILQGRPIEGHRRMSAVQKYLLQLKQSWLLGTLSNFWWQVGQKWAMKKSHWFLNGHASAWPKSKGRYVLFTLCKVSTIWNW